MLAHAKIGVSLRHWRRVFRGIWGVFSLRQKVTVTMSSVFPVINQATQILAFYLTIRLLLTCITVDVSREMLWLSGVAIALCFAATGIVTQIAIKIQVSARIGFKRIVRRFIAEKYRRIRDMDLSEEEANEAFIIEQSSEHHFHGPMIGVLISVIQVIGSILTVLSLISIVAFFAPAIAGIILISGVILIFTVRNFKSLRTNSERREKDESIEDIRDRARNVFVGGGENEELIQHYLMNDFDRREEREETARRKAQGTLQVLGIVFTSAILIATMSLVDVEAFRGFPEAALIVFLLMLKVCLQNVQNMIGQWGDLHRDRNLLTELGFGLERLGK
jgi:hypothetical protein